MAKFSVPPSPSIQTLIINDFLGCDFTNNPANVSEKKSPNATNMIRDVPGKVRKCMGHFEILKLDGKINGCHYLHKEEMPFIHSGTKIIRDKVEIYTDMADTRSKSWQFESKVYIIDGKKMVACFKEGEKWVVKPVSDIAKIPLFTIARTPLGGGHQYEDLNLLQPAFEENFLGTATDKTYQLSFGKLDETPVKAKKLNASGEWVDITEGAGFSVNRTTGTVTFTTAPGVSPVTGEDNVKITAYRTVEGYADRVNHCDIGTLFGVNGAADRLFISGNAKFPNYDWYSGQNDPTYFGDTAYGVLGQANSAIVGYAVINDRLAAHKDSNDPERNVILRSGDLVESKPVFKIINTLQGAGAIGKYTFAYLATEPLFLTSLGIYSITPTDITGEKYAQNRSYFLNGKLLKETDLQNAYAVTYKDMYWLCINGVVYILDGLQPLSPEKGMPYATRQYVGFYLDDIDAYTMWQHGDKLFFGTKTGEINEFYTDEKLNGSYNRNGKEIVARWELPDIDGNQFYKNKTFRYLVLRLNSAIATSVKVYSENRGLWRFVKEDDTKARYFSWSNIIWSKFTFSCDKSPKLIIVKKPGVKKTDKAKFAFVNDKANEPFGLFDVAIEFRESGNAK